MTQPLPPALQRFWLLSYAIGSTIYRVFVSAAIMLVVAFQLPVIGVIMAIGMGITFVVVPVFQVFKYVTIEPELHRKRGRAIAFSAATAAILIILVGLIRFPYNVYANGVVEAADRETVRATEGGFVSRIIAKDGSWLRKDDPILVLHSDELDKQIAQIEADRRGQAIAVRQAMTEDPAKQQIEQERLDNLDKQFGELTRRREALTIVAPFDGVFVNPGMREMDGRFIGPSQPVGTMLTMHEIEVRAVLEQRDVDRVVKDPHEKCEVRFSSDPSTVLEGYDIKLLGSAQDKLVSAAVGSGANGDIAIDPRDPKGLKPMIPQFEIRVRLSNPGNRFLPGQRATVRFQLEKKYPLIAQWSIRFWQLIQTKSAASQW